MTIDTYMFYNTQKPTREGVDVPVKFNNRYSIKDYFDNIGNNEANVYSMY